MSAHVVTRFPPSPTGLLHAGNYRTGIFNYLFARKSGGKFILRIEDTDRERSKKEYEENIVEALAWLGLSYDEFYRQSDHVARHAEALSGLIAKGAAYVSQEAPAEVNHSPTGAKARRGEVVRFRNPNVDVTFADLVRGPITINTADLGDFVIGRSVSEPLYHFSVVVDDMDEGVTHVIRGEDHISNTPRQILIQRALGAAEPPVYAHLPLVLGADRQKLSKRRGAKAITDYRDAGFIPEAIINYLALVGWHPEGDRELFTVPELVEEFTLERIQKGAGIFDEAKLRWFNHEHLKRLSDDEYAARLTDFMRGETPPYLPDIVALLKERAQTLAEAADMVKCEFDFLGADPAPTRELLVKGARADAATVKKHLEAVAKMIGALSNRFSAEEIKEIVFPYADQEGRGAVLWPLRVAISGKERSPDPFAVASLVGKEKALARIAAAIEKL